MQPACRDNASMLAKTSVAVAATLAPRSALASARASELASTARPSTFDEAIDSVRSSPLASRAGAGVAEAFHARISPSASETTPDSSAGRLKRSPTRPSGMKAW
jgi:hypothetical protein